MVIRIKQLSRSGPLKKSLDEYDARRRYVNNIAILELFNMMPDFWLTVEKPTFDNIIYIDFTHKVRMTPAVTHPTLSRFPKQFIRTTPDGAS